MNAGGSSMVPRLMGNAGNLCVEWARLLNCNLRYAHYEAGQFDTCCPPALRIQFAALFKTLRWTASDLAAPSET